MVLTLKQVKDKIKNPDQNIRVLQKEHKKLLVHTHGIGVAEYLTQIEGLENSVQIKLRKRLARSNKDLINEILRPTDKVFKAKGGSVQYGVPKGKESKFMEKLSETTEGMSLQKWIQTYFIDKLACDPNGMFLIEHKDGKAYPTYKSILNIHDYKQNGQYVEYVIFAPVKNLYDNQKIEEGTEYYRVYDDSGDNIYKKKGDEITLINDPVYSFKNPWGYVPAVIISNLTDTITGYKRSSLYYEIELLDAYLRNNSVKTLSLYHHGFPMFWQYMRRCPACNGVGSINKEDETGQFHTSECHTCMGTGFAMKKDVSDVIYLKPPETNDEPTISPDVAGYVAPPNDSFNLQTEELKLLRDMAFFSHWGTIINREDNEKTAFEVEANIQPIQDKLNEYTDSLETCERLLIDIIGNYYYAKTYKGTSLNYGRNYLMKNANQLLQEYLGYKEKGANYTLLNIKLKTYIQTLYQNNNYEQVIHMKLIDIEPWIHNTIDEVKKWGLQNSEFNKKLYYNSWLITKTQDQLFATNKKILISDFEQFVKLKTEENEKQREQTIILPGIHGNNTENRPGEEQEN